MMHGLHTFLLLHLLTCLGRNTLGSEIIHGKEASENSMLYMASVQNNARHVCGGFLISEDFVVTAAHCDERNLSVVLGTHNLKKVNDTTMRYSVKKCKHPYYKTVESGNDIMLLKLSRKARKVKPIQLPKHVMEMKDEEKCRVAGWGLITGGQPVDVLQKVDVPIINLNVCKTVWMQLPDNVICAGGYDTDKGFCQNNARHVCGGFLISEDFVVTAAHCDERNLSVVLGTHNLKKVNDTTMRYSVKKCKHPYYKNAKSGNDIMLLKLSRKARKVKPIQLPKPAMEMKDKEKCRVAGWGLITGRQRVDVLQKVDVPIINLNVCKKVWADWMQLPDNVICAGGYDTDKGFCQGDSGGPLVCRGMAVGVVSFNYKGNCNYPNAPNIYTDLSKHLRWIKNILKQKNC
ncbi:hypothetical protein PAMA_001569 [Pampus argenteus]